MTSQECDAAALDMIHATTRQLQAAEFASVGYLKQIKTLTDRLRMAEEAAYQMDGELAAMRHHWWVRLGRATGILR